MEYSQPFNMENRREDAGGMHLREGITLTSACFFRNMDIRCHGRSNRKLRRSAAQKSDRLLRPYVGLGDDIANCQVANSESLFSSQ